LQRAIRRYRHDVISVNEAARVEAMKKASPRVRALVKRHVDALSVHATYEKLVNDWKTSHFELVAKMKGSGMTAMSSAVGASTMRGQRLLDGYAKFCFETGLIRKAPTEVHIRAEHVVIADDRDAQQLIDALLSYIARDPERLSFLMESTTSVERMLQAPRPEPLPEDAARVLANARRLMAEAHAEKQAKALPPPTVRGPVDVGPAVPLFDDHEIGGGEELAPQATATARHVIDVAVDDGMPRRLESLW
jgi:hypothetical protein